MPISQHLEMIARASLQALDALSRAVWADFGAGKISEAEASAITEAIEARRAALRQPQARRRPAWFWYARAKNGCWRATSRALVRLHARPREGRASSCCGFRARPPMTGASRSSGAAASRHPA